MNISYSAISTFKLCRYKYKRQFIDRIDADTHYLRIGSSAHELIHEYLTNKVDIENSEKRLKEIHYENFKKKIDIEGGVFDKRLQEMFAEEMSDLNGIINKETLVRIEKNIGVDKIKNFKSEELIELIDMKHNLKYKGYIDLMFPRSNVYGYKNEESFVVVDFKTSRNVRYIDWLQFEFYVFLTYNYFKLHGKELPKKYHFILYFLRYNLKVDKYFVVDSQLEELTKRVYEISKEMYNEKHFNPSKNRFCNYCHLKDECPLFNKAGGSTNEKN